MRFWTVASVEQFTLEFTKMGLWLVWKLIKNRYAWEFSLLHKVHKKKKHLTSSSLSVVKLWKSYLQWFEDRMVSLNEPRNGFVRDKRLSLHLACKTFHLPVYELAPVPRLGEPSGYKSSMRRTKWVPLTIFLLFRSVISCVLVSMILWIAFTRQSNITAIKWTLYP